jgi:quercetin dioxygenase-like cupin family protein
MYEMMPKQLTAEEKFQIDADQSSKSCIFCYAQNLQWVAAGATKLRVMPTHQGVIQQATVAGHPDKPGWLTLRMKIPANYEVPPHYHPHAEHGTLLAGSYWLRLGQEFEKKDAQVLKPGDLFIIPVYTPHFGWTAEEGTEFQLDLIGPYAVTLCEAKG